MFYRLHTRLLLAGTLLLGWAAPATRAAEPPVGQPTPEVLRRDQIPAPHTSAGWLSGQALPPTGADDGTQDLDEVTVEGRRNYVRNRSSSGTRTDTPIRDVPASIQVVPRKVFEDQQAVRLDETLRNVSGVFTGGTTDGRGFNFSVRGFGNPSAPVLRDGFRVYSNFQGFAEVANLERIEVLKGPASVLYGDLEPGGIINLVSKQPREQPAYEAEVQVGSRGLIRPRFDIAGPLTADGSVLYRLGAVYQKSASFRNYANQFERFFVAPTFAFKIDPRTDLNVSVEYLNDNNPANFGTVAYQGGVVPVPPGRVTNNPEDTVNNQYLSVGYSFDHRFNEAWKLRNAFRYIRQSYDYSVLALPAAFNDTTGVLNRAFADQENRTQSYALLTTVEGKFQTGSVRHTLSLGLDYVRGEQFDITLYDLATAVPLNIFNPAYGSPAKPSPAQLPVFSNSSLSTSRFGVFLQDQAYLLDNLIVLAGVRYDAVDQRTQNAQSATVSVANQTAQYDDAFTPRVGLVYQPTRDVSLYASFSRSFAANSGRTVTGATLKPQLGEGIEAGVKAELLRGKLFATLAFYNITKRNVAVSDPAFFGFSVATGEQQSQGIELDVAGEILPGWNVIASYAYTDARVTADTNPVLIGNRLPSIPYNSTNLWTNYEIQTGTLKGLGLGLGFNYIGERQGGLPNSFQLDSYLLLNASISYRRDNWRIALNFKNLTDAAYIDSASTSRVRGIYPGEPFTAIASFAVEF